MNNIDDLRPDPDELLASLKEEEAKSNLGKLKVFFGMCAGVGKTYSMLQTARIEKEKGINVVVGYVETHNRKETETLLTGLTIIPRKKIQYKGTVLEEMDLDAILERKPDLVLVDELAHTNAPGSRHMKRYLDVQELLNNGISVFTTVNVQHIESKADTVTQITGITIRETFPDEIFEKADEIELVDITPEELIERFREGKVYAPQQSREALQNFFRTGNITALRELALRMVADQVEKQLRTYMQRKKLPGPWRTSLKLMVLIGPSPYAGRLIRWAKTLSFTMGAQLVAAHFEPSKTLSKEEQEQLNKNIILARQLGAEFISTSGNNQVSAILKLALRENVTHIIVGKPRHRTLVSLLRLGNFLNKLIRHSGNIDIYVLGSDVSYDKNFLKYIRPPSLTSGPSEYTLAAVVIALTAAICFPFKAYMGYQVVSFILLFMVSILALFLGIGPILLASAMSALLWDFFFIPPMMTFEIKETEDVFLLSMFFFIALLNGVLTYRLRKEQRRSNHREETTNALYKITRDLSNVNSIQKVVEVSLASVRRNFSVEGIILLQDNNNSLLPPLESRKEISLSKEDLSIASWVYRNQKKAGKFTETLPSTSYTFFPLPGMRIHPGVLAIKAKEPFIGEKEIFWDTFIQQIASAMEREFLDELAHRALILDESDKLYSTLFNSISHEFRIPVTTILGASDSILHQKLSPEIAIRLNQEIFTASERLNRLIENLLNMSRLESGRIEPKMDWCDVHDLVSIVLKNLENEVKNFQMEVVIPPDMPLVKLDFGLMEQVLYNLIFNATQHAEKGTTLRVKIYYDKPRFILQVMDRGTGIPPEEIRNVFNKFYRVKGSTNVGTGLGLAIVKGFVEAHNGTVTAENRIHGGARFSVRIPAECQDFTLDETENE
ncbi:MAG: sensor histidine kinase KdpD [Bacteroidota bacterium]|nr:sensor histidine kinase KdpD [Bacteroidota bacterium]